MITSPVKSPLAIAVRFDGEMLYVRLADGREVGAPLAWFPRLEKASREDRMHYRFIGQGQGIHWDAIDEDISVEALLGV